MKNQKTTEELIKRLEEPFGNTKASDINSDGAEYSNEIFLLEIPEGGDINQIRAVGFSGWEGTLKNEPKYPVRFYCQVIAFEDENAPHRNWQIKNEKIVIPDSETAKKLHKLLKTNYG